MTGSNSTNFLVEKNSDGLISRWLGEIDYQAGIDLQLGYSKKILQEKHQDVVLGLEHSAVITLGKRGDFSTDVRSSGNVPVFKVDRGGQATMHMPGQLVIYPILDLKRQRISIRQYVEMLQSTSVRVLNELGIQTQTCGQPGIFTSVGKIGFVGVRVENGISRHGISINVCNELSQFESIRSCGIAEARFDRVCHYLENSTPALVFEKWYRQFVFEMASSIPNLTALEAVAEPQEGPVVSGFETDHRLTSFPGLDN